MNAHSIRTVDLENLKIGGEDSLQFRPLFSLEVAIYNLDENFQIVKDFYKTTDRVKIIELAQESGCDIIGLKFNIDDVDKVSDACKLLKELLPKINKPLMIRGVNNDSIDSVLLPELVKVLDRESIVAFGNENTYKSIVPETAKGGHILVLRSPIDINLAKELNILSSDLGQPLDKILIDTDIGGLGYGLEYGYSIMEKVKLEGFNGDDYLNMPLISFVTEESLKTKEAKSDTYSASWGNLDERAKLFEVSSASAVVAAGANVVVLNNPDSVRIMKGLFK